MRYRRNSDSQLKTAEREYGAYPTRENLIRVDAIRLRSGLPPHRDSRIRAAKEIISFKEVRCLQYLRDAVTNGVLAPWLIDNHPLLNLDLDFEGGDEIADYPTLIQQQTALVGEMSRIRLLADDDLYRAASGEELLDAYKEMIQQYAPEHAFPATPEERMATIEVMRDIADHTCYQILVRLTQLGIFSLPNLVNAMEDDYEDATWTFEELQDILNACRMAHDEVYRALQGLPPDPEFVESIQPHKYYTQP